MAAATVHYAAAPQSVHASRALLGRYVPCRQVGVGSTATVSLAIDIVCRTAVALKFVKKTRSTRDKVVHEVRVQAAVAGHPNIAPVLDAVETADHYVLVEEYMPYGDLFEVIKPDVGMSERSVVSYAQEIALAIQHIHQNNVVHRDIKPENVCLTSTNSCRLIDFGHAAFANECNPQDYIGTVPYMAPELLMGPNRRLTVDFRQTDMFAFGVTLFVMATGKFPWKSATMDDPEYACYSLGGAGPCHVQRWASFSPEFTTLLRGTMCPDVTRRWTATRALCHIEMWLEDMKTVSSVCSTPSLSSFPTPASSPVQSASTVIAYPTPPPEPIFSIRSGSLKSCNLKNTCPKTLSSRRPAPYAKARPRKPVDSTLQANMRLTLATTPGQSPLSCAVLSPCGMSQEE